MMEEPVKDIEGLSYSKDMEQPIVSASHSGLMPCRDGESLVVTRLMMELTPSEKGEGGNAVGNNECRTPVTGHTVTRPNETKKR